MWRFFFTYRTDLRNFEVVVFLSVKHLEDYKCLLIDHAHMPSYRVQTLKKKKQTFSSEIKIEEKKLKNSKEDILTNRMQFHSSVIDEIIF